MCLTAFIAFILIGKAQNPAPPSSFEIHSEIIDTSYEISVEDILLGISSIDDALIERQYRAVIELLDTLNVENVHLSIGSQQDSADIYSDVLLFNTIGYDDSAPVYRKNSLIYIETSVVVGAGSVFGLIQLEDSNGNLSIEKEYPLN